MLKPKVSASIARTARRYKLDRHEVQTRHDNGEKFCTVCLQFKAFALFPKHGGTADGLDVRCKACRYATASHDSAPPPAPRAPVAPPPRAACEAMSDSDLAATVVADGSNAPDVEGRLVRELRGLYVAQYGEIEGRRRWRASLLEVLHPTKPITQTPAA